jgi:hypothetical protein
VFFLIMSPVQDKRGSQAEDCTKLRGPDDLGRKGVREGPKDRKARISAQALSPDRCGSESKGRLGQNRKKRINLGACLVSSL